MPEPDILVRIQHLAKSYGPVHAVRDVSMTLRRGQIYALLGRNGAGKTTTLRMLLGLARQHRGTVELFGQPVRRSRSNALARIGAMVEAPTSYPHLTGRQNLEITRRMLGLPRDAIDAALDVVELTDAADRRVKGYSLGMKGRLGLAIALLGSPELVILDEPLNGLDPGGIREVRQLIRAMPERGVTVLLSSHQLGEVEQIATHVCIVHDGVSRFEGSLEELRAASRPALRLRAEPESHAETLVTSLAKSIARTEDGMLVLHEPSAPAAAINRTLVQEGVDVHHLETHAASLEDLFLDLTADTDSEEAA